MDPPQAHDDRGDGHEHRTSARSTHQTLLLAQARRSGLPPRRLQDARARDSVAGTAMAEWPGSRAREARLDPSETTGRRWPKDVVDIVRQDLGLRDLPEGDALPETGWVRIFAAVASLLRFGNVRGPARTGESVGGDYVGGPVWASQRDMEIAGRPTGRHVRRSVPSRSRRRPAVAADAMVPEPGDDAPRRASENIPRLTRDLDRRPS